MSDIIFEPLAASVHFKSESRKTIQEWTAIIKDLMEKLGSLCGRSPQAVIGHIKCLCLLGEDHYIRASVISHKLPADVETNDSGARADLTMSLTMLVYGLPRTNLERFLSRAVMECLVTHQVAATVDLQTSASRKTHDHHDHKSGD